MRAAVACALVLCPGTGAVRAQPVAGAPPEREETATRGAAFEAALRQRLEGHVRSVREGGTQVLFGATLQGDAIASRRRQDGDEQDTLAVSATPFEPVAGVGRLSIRASQFDWVSRTPLPDAGYGWTRLQVNLFGPDGTTRPQLTQAWVRWGDALLAGKTYSTFMDDSVLPATLDYNGPSGTTFVRQWLVRGSVPVAGPVRADASVEQPQAASETALGEGVGLRTRAARPDLAARVRIEGDRAHLQLAGLSRSIDVETRDGAGTRTRRVAGRGVSVSGTVPAFGEDTLSGQWVRGDAIGRYFNDAVSATGAVLGADGSVTPATIEGVTLYYRRAWASGLSSTFGASRLRLAGDGGLRPDDALRSLTYASANLVWRLTPVTFAGVEVQRGEALAESGARAPNLRLQLTVRWLVF